MTSTDLIWKHFGALCAIPRPSGHERRAVEYVRGVAQACGLECHVDATGNILVRKHATPGAEGRRGVILQSHLDMVPQKNEDTVHDFLNDPIETYTDDLGNMYARGTTLGADNGVGAAAALAVLESSDIKHGRIEALFTVDEEAGMTGARAFAPGVLKGGAFINLDTEDEGEICVGCAGGVDVLATIPVRWAECEKEAGCVGIRLSVTGLLGGHSGLDINLGRGNAIKIIADCLADALLEFDARVAEVRGGNARNAIPREAFCELVVPEVKLEVFTRHVEMFESRLKSELSKSDPGVRVAIDKSDREITKVMTPASQRHLFAALTGCPCGVFGMSSAVIGMVETSSNIGVVGTTDTAVEVSCLVRSSIDAMRDVLSAKVVASFKVAEAEVRVSGGYPGWAPVHDSRLLAAMKQVYRETFGTEAKVTAVHAGLECGIIAAKYPDMEFVSIGPTIKHPHSPDECLDTKSVEKFWRYLTAVLECDL